MFKAGDGNDTITDFQDGDKIKFDSVPGVDDFEDLTMQQDGDDVVITYGAGGDQETITLTGADIGNIGSTDFTIAARATTRCMAAPAMTF